MRRALALSPHDYRIDDRLAEMAFGDWEGLTLAEVGMRDPEGLAARERDKWGFVPPNGESYQQVAVRIAQWYESLRADSVVAAHGGTMRALLVHLGIDEPETSPRLSIEQGVVYLLSPGRIELVTGVRGPALRASV